MAFPGWGLWLSNNNHVWKCLSLIMFVNKQWLTMDEPKDWNLQCGPAMGMCTCIVQKVYVCYHTMQKENLNFKNLNSSVIIIVIIIKILNDYIIIILIINTRNSNQPTIALPISYPHGCLNLMIRSCYIYMNETKYTKMGFYSWYSYRTKPRR